MANIRLAYGADRTAYGVRDLVPVGSPTTDYMEIDGAPLYTGPSIDSNFGFSIPGGQVFGIRYDTADPDATLTVASSWEIDTTLYGAQGEYVSAQPTLLWGDGGTGGSESMSIGIHDSTEEGGTYGRMDRYMRNGADGTLNPLLLNLPASDVPSQSNVICYVDYPGYSPACDEADPVSIAALYNQVLATTGVTWVGEPLVIEVATRGLIVDYDQSLDEGVNPNSTTGGVGYTTPVPGHPNDTSGAPPRYPLHLAGSRFLVVGAENRIVTPPPSTVTFRRVRNRDDGLMTGVGRAHATSRQRSIRCRAYF